MSNKKTGNQIETAIRELTEVPQEIADDLKKLISDQVMRKYRVAVFGRSDNGVLQVAMVSPHDIEALNILRFLAETENVSLDIYHADEPIFARLLVACQQSQGMVQDVMATFDGGETINRVPETTVTVGNVAVDFNASVAGAGQAELQDTSVARLVQVIVEHSLEARASDIHIEPIDKNYRVRFRVDGSLQSALVLPIDIGRSVVARIKILSNLKIDEKRKPQDGRFRVQYKHHSIDLRVSTFPVVEGEKTVLRVLDTSKGQTNLKELGLEGRNFDVMKRKIEEPYGIILITGPTGSGKSTTLYAFLTILNQDERNIVTLEDPVEYFLNGINQSQVKPEIGYTFANGLRSILRQDPNVIMVGEIRDEETAELATHAALTGQLVFSTLHTNTAVGAIPRLADMGIEPFLLASSLQAVMAQRLVRRICPDCRTPKEIPTRMLEQVTHMVTSIPNDELIAYDVPRDAAKQPIIRFFQGLGCDACRHTGFRGRLAVMEVLEVTPSIQEIIVDHRGNEVKMTEECKNQHMLSMREDGVLKALKGLTTLAEVEGVTEGNLFLDDTETAESVSVESISEEVSSQV